MATGAWKWVAGCGIGCLVIIVVVASLGVGGALLARGAVREVKRIADLQREVETHAGGLDDYAPRSGFIPAVRMEAFCTVRERLAEVMAQRSDSVDLPPQRAPQGFAEGLRALRGGIRTISSVGRLVETRNRALLDARMGFGEYYYLYATVYYAWLGHSPADCPRGVSLHRESHRHRVFFSDGEPPGDLIAAYRTTYVGMLRKALDDADDSDPWRAAVRAELAALDADPARMPWAEGLPPMVSVSIEPFRQRLESHYWRSANCFELATLQPSSRPREHLLEEPPPLPQPRDETRPAGTRNGSPLQGA